MTVFSEKFIMHENTGCLDPDTRGVDGYRFEQSVTLEECEEICKKGAGIKSGCNQCFFDCFV